MKIPRSTPPYNINQHSHRFAAWAASRAASVKGARFSVEQGRAVLEESGFDETFYNPDKLPPPQDMDKVHRFWRKRVINAARQRDLKFTDGVAAKLINCYLKSRFVCGGHHLHRRVHHIHPPIDELLLKELAGRDIGGFGQGWKKARKKRWSKFSSRDYENVIAAARKHLRDQPLWMIEEHWQGFQQKF